MFDEYLREGREYAAGRSAWYDRPSGPAGASAVPADLLGALRWIFEQLGRPSQPPSTAQARSEPWPQPRWPSTPAFHPQQDPRYSAAPPEPSVSPSRDDHDDWEEWDFVTPTQSPHSPAPEHQQVASKQARPSVTQKRDDGGSNSPVHSTSVSPRHRPPWTAPVKDRS